MENTNNNDSRAAEIRGRYNLEMGVHLAWEEVQKEMDAIANDDSLPRMAPEDVQELLSAVNKEYDRLQAVKKRKIRRKRLLQWGLAAAAALIIIPTAAMNVNASRTAISNYVIQNFGKYSSVQYENGNNVSAPFGWRSEYYPRWIPEGYQLDSVRFLDGSDYLWYISEDGKELGFSVQHFTDQHFVNSENHTATEISVNGRNATLYLSKDKREAILFLPLTDCAIQIEGMVSEKILCSMAESVIIS